MVRLAASLLFAIPLVAQEPPAHPELDSAARNSVIESLAARIQAGYVLPEAGDRAVRALRTVQASGAYDQIKGAQAFAERLTSDLRAATHDKHFSVYFDPEHAAANPSPQPQPAPREFLNFGFFKVERLRGNVGYLDLRSFADLQQGRETASLYLGGLANFDAIILDLRENGGGNSPMMSFIASYFFSSTPVHLMDIYWRDRNETSEFWTFQNVPGPRSVRQNLYILVGPSTFSAAEGFTYSLQQLKRAIVVGEKTGGGAHSGRGLQRLSPLFTAFIPVGRSLNPVTHSNWEGTGVEPDVAVPAPKALNEAHLLALRGLLEKEADPSLRNTLRQLIDEMLAK